MRFPAALRVLFAGTFVAFTFNKLVLREWLQATSAPDILVLLSYSMPNTAEAIIGTIVLAGFGTEFQRRRIAPRSRLKQPTLYAVVTVLAAIYVLSQEVGLHALGGNNVYDPNDVLASIVGLIVAYLALRRWGPAVEEAAASS